VVGPGGHLHMLLFSASYDGQGAVAIQGAKDYAKLVDDREFYRALTKFRFGRMDEIRIGPANAVSVPFGRIGG
jgi:hypothetical protein